MEYHLLFIKYKEQKIIYIRMSEGHYFITLYNFQIQACKSYRFDTFFD